MFGIKDRIITQYYILRFICQKSNVTINRVDAEDEDVE